jgi:hypothetical protein
MAGSVILPYHVERNKGKGVYQQRGKEPFQACSVFVDVVSASAVDLRFSPVPVRMCSYTNLLHHALSLLTC